MSFNTFSVQPSPYSCTWSNNYDKDLSNYSNNQHMIQSQNTQIISSPPLQPWQLISNSQYYQPVNSLPSSPHPFSSPTPQPSCPEAWANVSPQPASGSDIPDLRPQWLASHYRGEPGQVVMMPPLTGDHSAQTIQILTPLPSDPGKFSVQSIVLPVVRVTSPGLQPQWTKSADVSSEEETKPIIQDEEENINKIDGIGLPSVMQGIDLDQIKQFAAEFKSARIQLGLTQTQVGQALNTAAVTGMTVSQSTICRFEKLEITALQVKKLLPALKAWLEEAKRRHSEGLPVILEDSQSASEIKKRKRRTVFNQETVTELCREFEKNTSPTGSQLSEIAERLGLDKETTRVWFCNKRQQYNKWVRGQGETS